MRVPVANYYLPGHRPDNPKILKIHRFRFNKQLMGADPEFVHHIASLALQASGEYYGWGAKPPEAVHAVAKAMPRRGNHYVAFGPLPNGERRPVAMLLSKNTHTRFGLRPGSLLIHSLVRNPDFAASDAAAAAPRVLAYHLLAHDPRLGATTPVEVSPQAQDFMEELGYTIGVDTTYRDAGIGPQASCDVPILPTVASLRAGLERRIAA